MDQESALGVWESWAAAQQFKAKRSVPDREMLDALLDCDRSAKQGDLEALGLRKGLTIGEAASELKSMHYP